MDELWEMVLGNKHLSVSTRPSAMSDTGITVQQVQRTSRIDISANRAFTPSTIFAYRAFSYVSNLSLLVAQEKIAYCPLPFSFPLTPLASPQQTCAETCKKSSEPHLVLSRS